MLVEWEGRRVDRIDDLVSFRCRGKEGYSDSGAGVKVQKLAVREAIFGIHLSDLVCHELALRLRSQSVGSETPQLEVAYGNLATSLPSKVTNSKAQGEAASAEPWVDFEMVTAR